MNSIETKQFLEYAMSIYPSARMSESLLDKTAKIWAAELSDEPLRRVIEAFKVARAESPDWMPTLPKIQAALDTLPRKKTQDEEFRDSHCGKTRAEWEQYEEWANSDSGRHKIEQYKARLRNILGV